MRLSHSLAILVLAGLPVIAAAQEPGQQCDHQRTQSCADGQQIDAETGTCVPVATS